MSLNTSKPPVSIIICHYSKPDDYGGLRASNQKETRSQMLHITMDSLEKNTNYPAEVIVWDNGGDLDDSNYLLDLTRKGVINTYIRAKDNMHFAYAWNQCIKLAQFDYICLTCNDIEFKKNWLEETIAPLLKYPEKKYIATPLITPDKDKQKYHKGMINGGYRLNTTAGSNCMLLHKNVLDDVGEFRIDVIAGTFWYRKMHRMGYMMVATPKNKVNHLAHAGGLNIYQPIDVQSKLLDNTIINYG